jgi:hypothetical protein
MLYRKINKYLFYDKILLLGSTKFNEYYYSRRPIYVFSSFFNFIFLLLMVQYWKPIWRPSSSLGKSLFLVGRSGRQIGSPSIEFWLHAVPNHNVIELFILIEVGGESAWKNVIKRSKLLAYGKPLPP